jgi:hypothetical protein
MYLDFKHGYAAWPLALSAKTALSSCILKESVEVCAPKSPQSRREAINISRY